MPRVVCPAFLDPSNTASSIQASASRFVNSYLESIAPGHGKSPTWRVRTPGMHPKLVFPDAPIRGLYEINDRCFAVGGVTFAEVLDDYTLGPTFTVANDADDSPVSFASNGTAGHQVLVSSAGIGYIYDLIANTLTVVSAPGFPTSCRMVEFMDGYFLALEDNSRSFSWSALEDGTSWDALDVAERSEAADSVTALIRNHREIWLIGFRTSEVWYDQGDPSTVFAPLQGVFIEHGGQGPFAVRRIDNTLMWIGLNDDGQGVVWRADGYTPKRVSTSAVEVWLQRATDPTAATAWVYQMNGHVFYVLIIPGETTAWVYDVTMDRWHEWAYWNPIACEFLPTVAGCHVFVFNTHLVGDRYSGAIYELNQDFFDDEIVAA